MYIIKNKIESKVNGGAITLMSKGPVEDLVLLGASCEASVSLEDGGVKSFVVIPAYSTDVIVVAVMCGYDRHIEHVFLLGVKKEGEKCAVELEQQFACSEKVVGQLVIKDNSIQLRVTTSDKQKYVSRIWSPKLSSDVVAGPVANGKITSPEVPSNSFDILCRFIAGKPLGKVQVQLLTSAHTPDVVVNADILAPAWGAGHDAGMQISVCAGQGCAYEGQPLWAHWRANQWEVAHPSC